MRIITSFSPNRIERQRYCLQSWLDRKCEVIAVQPHREINDISLHFPGVQFIGTDLLETAFGGSNRIRISALLSQCLDQPGLIVNSDIHMTSPIEKFDADWEVDENSFKIGIRWEQLPRTGEVRLQKHGIDAFLITPEIANNTPDIGMSIGAPVWDYWLPFHVVSQLNKKLITNKSDHLRHVVHEQNWSNSESIIGFRLVQEHYGISVKGLNDWIQQATGRSSIHNWYATVSSRPKS